MDDFFREILVPSPCLANTALPDFDALIQTSSAASSSATTQVSGEREDGVVVGRDGVLDIHFGDERSTSEVDWVDEVGIHRLLEEMAGMTEESSAGDMYAGLGLDMTHGWDMAAAVDVF